METPLPLASKGLVARLKMCLQMPLHLKLSSTFRLEAGKVLQTMRQCCALSTVELRPKWWFVVAITERLPRSQCHRHGGGLVPQFRSAEGVMDAEVSVRAGGRAEHVSQASLIGGTIRAIPGVSGIRSRQTGRPANLPVVTSIGTSRRNLLRWPRPLSATCPRAWSL